jgi:hypothetical protein
MFIGWAVIGLLIGIWAASAKKFSVVGGAIAGALLGPLSVLLFVVSGDTRKCPWCLEMMNRQATVCARCQRESFHPPIVKSPQGDVAVSNWYLFTQKEGPKGPYPEDFIIQAISSAVGTKAAWNPSAPIRAEGGEVWMTLKSNPRFAQAMRKR